MALLSVTRTSTYKWSIDARVNSELFAPSNKKWYRDFAIARALVERLAPHTQRWHDELLERGKTELERIRAAHINEQ